MTAGELLQWQWRGYPRYHQSAFNLLLHIATWPFFLAGNVMTLTFLARGRFGLAGLALVMSVLAFGLQGLGHKGETNPPEPFTGPKNALARVFLEQWVTFPRFVFTGGWFGALRRAVAP